MRIAGEEVSGKPAHKIARAGIGYVPQGRRLFQSLTVDEHLQISARRRRRGVDPGPRVRAVPAAGRAQARVGGTSLSGGEQQMLSIGRALLTNPKLLVMDEPSEGLAPTVVEKLIETIKDLAAGGHGPAAWSSRTSAWRPRWPSASLVMVSGSIATETTSAELLADPEAQQRFLGVEPLAEAA